MLRVKCFGKNHFPNNILQKACQTSVFTNMSHNFAAKRLFAYLRINYNE